MQIGNLLVGYTSAATAYKVDDYPWGFRLRTSIHYWIETKLGKGDRFGSYTIDPRTGRKCKPKYSTYSPFLYMYLSEDEGHVKTGGIDSFKPEYFRDRFVFIQAKLLPYISEDQKTNLRVEHYNHVRMNSPFDLVKYCDGRKDEFKQWVSSTLKHIKTCDFKDLVDYPEQPAYDYPNNEVEVITTITEYNG